jgi:hypothetical protein
VKYARVGGHETYVSSLDVRVLGIAGGSLVRLANGKLVDVGPRRAHIAGLAYAAFASPDVFQGATVELFQPGPGESADHVAIRGLEMLKGIRGVGNRDVHLVPVIRNTPREGELRFVLPGYGMDERGHRARDERERIGLSGSRHLASGRFQIPRHREKGAAPLEDGDAPRAQHGGARAARGLDAAPPG